MPLHVFPSDPDKTPAAGLLLHSGRTLACALGRTGIRDEKREGDGATPSGTFPLRRVLYRPDRGPRPRTCLPVAALTPDDGWCDDPADSAYNRPVQLPHGASAEHLWRDDHLYDVIVVIGHNDDPVVPGAGSAIFLHVAAPDFSPTEGCVALKKDELLEILAELGPDDQIEISGRPADRDHAAA
ncbi:MAG TPA: L,D-transpeptidase family protein [Alphaproteobacteria bacterium]|nr:L,D-transpeptidase family protein [Alphaproteobacteria bacterium]